MPGRRGASHASSGSAGCSPLRCGTAIPETLFLARDRLGVKPLYYAQLPDGQLLFASELKALVAHGGCRPISIRWRSRTILPSATFRNPLHIHCGEKAAAGIDACRPARQPLPEPREFWDVRFAPDPAIDAVAAEEELIARLRESIRLRMISEVPLGAFLSGGVDSSAVVAFDGGAVEGAGEYLFDLLRRPGL